jgi:hypothetical protein
MEDKRVDCVFFGEGKVRKETNIGGLSALLLGPSVFFFNEIGENMNFSIHKKRHRIHSLNL